MKLTKKKYIAAVSGGPDSMALLDKYKECIVGVCHVNYHKRVDSDHDTKIVMDYCSNHSIPVLVYDVDKKIYKNASQHNFQALARDIRYEFFVECSKQFKCSNLLIAHNLNDFLETAIMQQNRNSNNFYYGIKQETKYKNLNIFRPLINVFKADLEQYCKDNKIDYAIDSSNVQDIYERNRIRKQINKLSKAKQLALARSFRSRNSKQAKKQLEVEKLLKQWKDKDYSVSFFKEVKKQFQESLIYLYLKKYNLYVINYNKIKLVRDFIVSSKSNITLRLETNVNLVKKNKVIKVVRHEKSK